MQQNEPNTVVEHHLRQSGQLSTLPQMPINFPLVATYNKQEEALGVFFLLDRNPSPGHHTHENYHYYKHDSGANSNVSIIPLNLKDLYM